MVTCENRNRFHSILLVALPFFITSSSVQALWADEYVWSVQKLNDSKPWDRFIGSPQPVRVEGRLGITGPGQFRLLRSDARFMIDNSKLRSLNLNNVGEVKTVEVKGRFKKDGLRVDFFVDDLKVINSYAQQYETRASKLRRPTAEEWIELGDWVATKAKFYDDAELTKKANDAYANAIEVEYKSLKQSDAEGRFALAKKVDEYKLSPRRRMELIHEGFRIQWQAAQKIEPPDVKSWQQLANTIGDQLPGTKEPLKMVPPDLKETYEQDPVSTYQKANDDLRIHLHRLFVVGIIRQILLQGASSDGRDGDAIADQIDNRIPEEHALAEKYRLMQLAYRVAHITTATRAEVEKLAAAFRDRQRNEEAKQAIVQWIKAHEPRLKGDGVIGLLQLADEYLSLLNDEQTAVEYLARAYEIDPNFDEARSKLISLGFQWQNGRWNKTDLGHRRMTNPGSQSPTGISVGLPASGLRRLLGEPRSLARAITARGITEVWSFGPAGSTPLIVRLEQKARDNEPKVSAFSGQ